MSEGSNPEFIGYMYDLKQTPEGGKSDITADSYSNVIDDFLDRHWSDSVLSHYYKFDKPIHATQIFIPNMDASLGPAAFGAEEKIKPSCWVIHYKARVSPPTPGIYRFWGIADDIMAVAVDGRTVLAGNRSDTVLRKLTWKSSLPEGAQAADGKLRAGSWVQFQAGEAVNLDVIIGERPGGQFNAFMLVEKQGDNYQKDSDGNPILPIFQLAPKITPPDSALQKQPLFSTVPAIWTPQARDN